MFGAEQEGEDGLELSLYHPEQDNTERILLPSSICLLITGLTKCWQFPALICVALREHIYQSNNCYHRVKPSEHLA